MITTILLSVLWGILILLAAWEAFNLGRTRFARWLQFHFSRTFILRRECAWCRPMRYIGGNPFSKKVSHGRCRRCMKALEAELALEAQRELEAGVDHFHRHRHSVNN